MSSPASSTSREQRGERVVVDQRAGEPDALVEADQMRAGEHVDACARGFERGAQEGAGRALAVGPGDMEHRRQRVLRTAEPVEQGGDAGEAEPVAARRQQARRSSCGLDAAGRSERREVGHQAACLLAGAR